MFYSICESRNYLIDFNLIALTLTIPTTNTNFVSEAFCVLGWLINYVLCACVFGNNSLKIWNTINSSNILVGNIFSFLYYTYLMKGFAKLLLFNYYLKDTINKFWTQKSLDLWSQKSYFELFTQFLVSDFFLLKPLFNF